MARHVLDGQFTTFYWGQPYGGTQEVLLVAGTFAIAGTSLVALRAVPFLLSALAAFVVWRVGRRALGDPAAAVAGALLWVWPPYPIVRTTGEFGFYASNLVYCALLLLLALRIVERPTRLRVGVFGLVLGLGFWQTAQIIPVAIPVIGWTVWKRPSCLRHFPVGLGLAALGAAPWLVWNLRHDWASVMPRSSSGEYVHGLRLFASPLLPMILGLRAPLSAQLLLPKILTYIVYVGLLVLFAVMAYRTRRTNVSLLYSVAAVFPFIWPISHRVTVLTSTPMFLVVLSPVLALLVAQLATTYLRAAVVLAAALVVSVVSIQRMNVWLGSGEPHFPPTTPRDFTPLVHELDRLHIDHVYANYWIGYRLAFATNERILAAQYPYSSLVASYGQLNPSSPAPGRYPPYRREVERVRHGFVVFRSDQLGQDVIARLRENGYRGYNVGPFSLYAPGS